MAAVHDVAVETSAPGARASRRQPMRLFFRIKDIRGIDPKGDQFTVRFRYFAYFDHDELKKQLVADESAASFADLLRSATRAKPFKVKTTQLSDAARALLPTLSVPDRIADLAVTGAAELIAKDRAVARDAAGRGFDFCLTEQLNGPISHFFDLRSFPFDFHRMPVRMALRKARDRKAWYLAVADDGFVDDDETIPYYKAGTGPKPWLAAGWREAAARDGLSPVEFEAFDLAEWNVHAGGGGGASACRPWDASGGQGRKPTVEAVLLVSRRDAFYINNVMLLNSLIVSTVFTAPFGGEPTGDDVTSKRLANDLVLVLTTVAFTISVNDRLPALPYNTVLGKHCNICLALVFAMLLAHAVEGPTALGVSARADAVSHAAAFGAWLLYHVVLLCAIRAKRRRLRESYGAPMATNASEFTTRRSKAEAAHPLWPLFTAPSSSCCARARACCCRH